MSAPKEQSEAGKRTRGAQKPPQSVNMEELRELIALLRDNGLAELELENEGFRVRLRRESEQTESSPAAVQHYVPAPAPAPAPSGPAHPGTQATTAAAQGSAGVAPWWVEASSSLALVEYRDDELVRVRSTGDRCQQRITRASYLIYPLTSRHQSLDDFD